ncbi:MAG: hypothetical protein AVDCRST_MAG74-3133 [uncultured Pyrinomonadaceae bacterium]|uniref:Uncharacterized protein n=1 Tax=uncultured Pyrinomonadaceae bacterium TaxID=2283094 RepID=A0A6J4PV36_9BACT|nr:MAG: hypothetical protein AVDCRST_MAG74-3133 [uncultured Pyrinomonadaceae bacterium]
MKKVLILSLATLFSISCSSAVQQADAPSNQNAGTVKSNDSAIVSSHSAEAGKTVSPSAPDKPVSSASTESPMARPIDAAEMTADIERAEQAFKKNPKAKEDLAKAYFVRATALTGAAQYRAALGDYRKGLNLNPTDEEARKMHDQILSIFKSIGREPPKEGEEPKPLPFKKES